ncbi:hypothetical protein ACFCYM_34725 [Streptomyces sp. NPDC056254]|uniref:hypothetical protein n=1 Tax=Streptomyces sp. NPDC056254 TaxID=3345763 RepID=UPI0035DE4674
MRKTKAGCLAVLLLTAAMCCTAPAVLAAAASWHAGQDPKDAATAAIPPRMMDAYLTSAPQATTYVPGCRGMRWQILAAIAHGESDHATGRHIAPNGDVTPPIAGPRLDGTGTGTGTGTAGNTTAIKDTDNGQWDTDTD